jgi:hypothetical protein
MNIEKEFYKKIKDRYGECSPIIYELVRDGLLGTSNMEKYLIKTEFLEQLEKQNGKKKMAIYIDLAEKYSTSVDKIIYIAVRQ